MDKWSHVQSVFLQAIKLIIGTGNWTEIDSYSTAFVFFIFLAFASNNFRFPSALIVFFVGIFLAIGVIVRDSLPFEYHFISPFRWAPADWVGSDWRDGTLVGALPQVCAVQCAPCIFLFLVNQTGEKESPREREKFWS